MRFRSKRPFAQYSFAGQARRPPYRCAHLPLYIYSRSNSAPKPLAVVSRQMPSALSKRRSTTLRSPVQYTSRGACPAPFVCPPVARRVAPRRSMARDRGPLNWTTGGYRSSLAPIIATERHAKALRSLDFEARTGALLAPSRLRCRRTTTTRPRLLQSRSIWPPSPRLHRYRREKPP